MGNHIYLTPMTKPVLDQLFTLIESRKNELPEGSYTSSLFSHERGENAVLEKIGEEATELILAAKDNNHQEIIHEAADVVYHLLVLLSMKGVHLNDLLLELQSREK
jgi:phosphoribosyl-ATP pyrophosphohydrolase